MQMCLTARTSALPTGRAVTGCGKTLRRMEGSRMCKVTVPRVLVRVRVRAGVSRELHGVRICVSLTFGRSHNTLAAR